MEIIALLRDLVIILLGIVWIVAGVLVAVVAFVAWRLIRAIPRRVESVTVPARELYGQVREVVVTAGQGARTGKEAVGFVSEKAVAPTITVVAAVAGARQFIRTLMTGTRRLREEDLV